MFTLQIKKILKVFSDSTSDGSQVEQNVRARAVTTSLSRAVRCDMVVTGSRLCNVCNRRHHCVGLVLLLHNLQDLPPQRPLPHPRGTTPFPHIIRRLLYGLYTNIYTVKHATGDLFCVPRLLYQSGAHIFCYMG